MRCTCAGWGPVAGRYELGSGRGREDHGPHAGGGQGGLRQPVRRQDAGRLAGRHHGYVPEDGVMVCKPGGNVFTKKEYGDFIFRFEFKLEPNANNGVGIRTPLGGNPAYTAWRSRSSTTRAALPAPPALPVPRLDLRRGARQAGAPEAGRPVEQRGDLRQGEPHQGHAQRHGDRRRRPEQDQGHDGPPEAPRACTTPRATSASWATAPASSSATSASRSCKQQGSRLRLRNQVDRRRKALEQAMETVRQTDDAGTARPRGGRPVAGARWRSSCCWPSTCSTTSTARCWRPWSPTSASTCWLRTTRTPRPRRACSPRPF